MDTGTLSNVFFPFLFFFFSCYEQCFEHHLCKCLLGTSLIKDYEPLTLVLKKIFYRLYLLGQFQVHSKIEQKIQRVLAYPHPDPRPPPPSTRDQRGTSITDEIGRIQGGMAVDGAPPLK